MRNESSPALSATRIWQCRSRAALNVLAALILTLVSACDGADDADTNTDPSRPTAGEDASSAGDAGTRSNDSDPGFAHDDAQSANVLVDAASPTPHDAMAPYSGDAATYDAQSANDASSVASADASTAPADDASATAGSDAAALLARVRGTVRDARGAPLAAVAITIEHTFYTGVYVQTSSDASGHYSAAIPADPAGSWTVKAQLQRSAYGQTYKFDLLPSSLDPFTREAGAQRDFEWRLSGQRPNQSGDLGAHVDLYQFGTDVALDQVRLLFTPVESTLIDGSPAQPFERAVEQRAGTFMARDIPVGIYRVRAVHPEKTLLLENRHEEQTAAVEQTVVFGKSGFLADTEYNIEFWLSE